MGSVATSRPPRRCSLHSPSTLRQDRHKDLYSSSGMFDDFLRIPIPGKALCRRFILVPVSRVWGRVLSHQDGVFEAPPPFFSLSTRAYRSLRSATSNLPFVVSVNGGQVHCRGSRNHPLVRSPQPASLVLFPKDSCFADRRRLLARGGNRPSDPRSPYIAVSRVIRGDQSPPSVRRVRTVTLLPHSKRSQFFFF